MDEAARDQHFALCLSGGGLRATLFHLGVIRAMRVIDGKGSRPIDRLAEVYSVSGGSILAAYMIAHWDQITGNDDAFADAEKAILTFCGSGLRDRVIRRAVTQRLWDVLFFLWPKRLAPAWLGKSVARSRRAHWLTQEYRALLGEATTSGSASLFPSLPRFYILSTSFRSADLCAFTNTGFEVERRDGSFEAGPPARVSLAAAVAASSAFPPLFPPISFSADILDSPQNASKPRSDADAKRTILLSDGGIYDNLGVEKYRARRTRAPSSTPAHLVISDAGSAFRNDDVDSFAGVIGRNVRASDVLMDRVARATKKEVNALTDIVDLVISIHPLPDSAGTASSDVQELQQLYGGVRTDLDRFDADLSTLLVDWGEQAARQVFASDIELFATYPACAASVAPDRSQSAILTAAGKRNLRSVLRSGGDFGWSWALRATIATLLFLGVVVPIGVVTATVTTLIQNGRAEERQKVTNEAAAARDDLIKSYDGVYSEIADATVSSDIASIRRILIRERADLFAKRVAVQERVAVVDGTAGVATHAASPTPSAANKVDYQQRIFIQFAGTYTRAQITALNARLRAAGWNMQSASGERVGTAQGRNEVRYGEGGADAADALTNALNASTETNIRVGTPKFMPIIGNRNLEIWISN